jgi:hypothetical protein
VIDVVLIATCLWDANENSQPFSCCYDETWVEKLRRGFDRNLTVQHEMVVFVDHPRGFSPGIRQHCLTSEKPGYFSMVEPFMLNAPMILVGLDTIVTGNVDHLAYYCQTADRIALPRPIPGGECCNGVVLAPAGQRSVYDQWRDENDMVWLRSRPHNIIDDLFPYSVVSYKLQDVRKRGGLRDERIVYFHGLPKPNQLTEPWILEHWR